MRLARLLSMGRKGKGIRQDVVEEKRAVINSAVSVYDDGVRIRIHAKPGASYSNVCSVGSEEIEIRIGARPKEGEANDELVDYLASVGFILRNILTLNRFWK